MYQTLVMSEVTTENAVSSVCICILLSHMCPALLLGQMSAGSSHTVVHSFLAFRDPSLRQEQKDALFQELQKKLLKAEKLLEPSHSTEKLCGIGEYKLCIIVKNSVIWDVHCADK
jgi:hypothetical protein